MMSKRPIFIAALVVTCLCIGSASVFAQTPTSCSEMVDTALTSTSFVIGLDVLQELKSFPSDPLSVYRVAALNLPVSDNNMLNVLVMGQATLETNDVSTSVTETIEPAEATANSNANLRNSPSTNGALAGTVNAGDTLELVGKNAAGDWYQVLLASQEKVWIFSNLVTVTDTAALANLPVSEGDDTAETTSLPALSLMFRAATEEAACADAAAGLTVQSPVDTNATFSLNGTTVDLQGTVIIQTLPIEIAGDTGNNILTIATLVNGQMTVNLDNRPVALTQAGDTLGITPAKTLHPAEAELLERFRAVFGDICENTVKTDLFLTPSDLCETIILRDISTTLPQFADTLGDVLVLGTNQAATAEDARGADILGINIRRASPTEDMVEGYWVDLLLDIPASTTFDTAHSFAIALWEGNNTGLLYQIHIGVPTIGVINANFVATPGTEGRVSATGNVVSFNVGAETKSIDIESYLMLKPDSKRVGDTFHSDIDESMIGS